MQISWTQNTFLTCGLIAIAHGTLLRATAIREAFALVYRVPFFLPRLLLLVWISLLDVRWRRLFVSRTLSIVLSMYTIARNGLALSGAGHSNASMM